ncbi:facilitated trehalose transporter Tret1-like isoform X1 [Bombus huntii]|uniref:facilitated trehalose transporter Tret1-like isoform X1 n=2 Tax=Bombus huntii TaxID=85661 RepID=UPI0021AA5633|nr:facilitated trehalose transporter Tret1-like isoform X1 [Bombus huntii]
MSNARIYLITFVVCLAQLNADLFLEWTSPMITKSSVNDFPFEIAIDEASWIVSSLKLGTAFGCFLSIFIVDFLGRKISILLTIIPTCLSWLLRIWNPSILNLYVASFIGGIVSGIIFTSGSIFVTETSPAHIRGALCSCFVLMHYCSNLLGCVVGSFSTVYQYSYVAISLAMLQFLIFIWCPETPYYLLRRKKFAAAMDSLIFLRGSGDVAEEMDSIIRAVESNPRCNGILSSILHLISESGGKAAILIGAGVMTVQAFSSSIILISYAQTIFEKIHDVQLQGVYTSIVLATVYLISYLMCISLVDRLGRRPLMVISTIGVSSCSFLLAVYFCMQENAVDTTNLRLLSFVAVLFYTISCSLGLASVPFVVVNEIFPIYAKATCISFCFCINFVWSFIALRVWSEIMFEHNAYSLIFWFISGLNTFSIFFLVFYFPETKRESLLQIRKNFIEGMKK